MLYSASTGGFYVSDVHTDIPGDAVEITAEAYSALLDGQSAGQRIVPDGAGNPVLQDPDPIPLDDLKLAKITAAYNESQRRFAASAVSVTVNGALRQYGCDPATRENVTAINTAIGCAPSLVPNPRYFTPRGEAPVLTTHDEFLAIYLAGIAAGDLYYGAYYAHKVAISALTTAEAVASYDLSAGWPS